MADDLQDLEGIEFFTLKHDWVKQPSYNLVPLRRLLSFAGTADALQSLGDVPIFSCNARYLLYNRTLKNYFLSFIKDCKGRNNRFWFRHPYSFFTLKSNVSIGATTLYVERQEFDWIYQGYERIYLDMSNGDIITRKLVSVVESVLNDRLELSFTPGLDRDLTTTDKHIMGRLLLCRFDIDAFNVKPLSGEISEVDVKVVELIKEYGEI